VSPIAIAAFRALAASVEVVHALAMLVWGVGLPLLLWHRYKRLSRAYMWFAVVFVMTSVLSHVYFGECFLTTLARRFWIAGGGFREHVPFTALLANTIAGIRPSARTTVVVWEIAILATSVSTLWCWRKTRGANSSTHSGEASS
jgi:hypothetical protein